MDVMGGMGNVLGAFLTAENLPVFEKMGDSGLGLSAFGKKYVEYFFTHGL